MINGINIEQFKKYNFLYISNVLQGIENYKHICFTGQFKDYKSFIKSLVEDNKLSFFDFYFCNLQENEKQAFNKINNYDNIIKRFKFNKDELYFNIEHIDDEVFEFILKISYEEILFSTFYFKDPAMLLWTNYNKEFILFFKDDRDILKYKKLSEKLNLKILFEKV